TEREPPGGARPLVVSVEGLTLREAGEATKRTLVLRAVEDHGGNWAAAARSLGLARSNLHQLAERLGLRKGASASRRTAVRARDTGALRSHDAATKLDGRWTASRLARMFFRELGHHGARRGAAVRARVEGSCRGGRCVTSVRRRVSGGWRRRGGADGG